MSNEQLKQEEPTATWAPLVDFLRRNPGYKTKPAAGGVALVSPLRKVQQ